MKEKKPKIKRVHTKKEFSWGKLLLNIFSIVSGIAVFIGFVFLQDFLSEKVTYGTVVVATKEIKKDTTITKENVESYFELKEIDSKYLPKNVVTDMATLYPSKTANSFVPGEIAIQKDFVDISSYSSTVKEPSFVSISANSIAAASSGKIRTGDIVNVYMYIEGEHLEKFEQEERVGNYVTLLKNAYVLKAMNSDGSEIETTDTSSCATLFLFEIEQSEQLQFLNKMAMGSEIIISKVNVEQFYKDSEEATEEEPVSKEETSEDNQNSEDNQKNSDSLKPIHIEEDSNIEEENSSIEKDSNKEYSLEDVSLEEIPKESSQDETLKEELQGAVPYEMDSESPKKEPIDNESNEESSRIEDRKEENNITKNALE